MGNSVILSCFMAQIVWKKAKIRSNMREGVCVCECVISIDFQLDNLFNNQLNLDNGLTANT